MNMQDEERKYKELKVIKQPIIQDPAQATKIAASLGDIKHEKRVVELKIEQLLTEYTQRFGIPLNVEVGIVDIQSFNDMCGATYQVITEGLIQ